MRRIEKIVIEFIDEKEHRYPTTGDYFFEGNVLKIRVSKMKDNRHELLVAVHELTEVILTEHDGVSEESITEFDKEFERNRTEHSIEEPGDDPNAPYKKQHNVASGIERIMAGLLDVDWNEYENSF